MINITSNIDQVIERFKAKANQTSNVDVSQALLAGVNAARGAMTNRIFNKGFDAQETSLGKYTGKKGKKATRKLNKKEQKVKDFLIGAQSDFSEYELVRLREGRQIRYKDEERTGSLRRGIVTIKENSNRVVCAIPSDRLFSIAGYQEEQIAAIRTGRGKGTRGGARVPIFSLSEKERELLKTNTQEILKQIYDNILNG